MVGLRVLSGINQNIRLSQTEQTVRKHKEGSWKGRPRENKGVQMVGSPNDEHLLREKREFCLVDEEETLEVLDQNGKKVKVRSEEMVICEELVEETSHNWPQMN